LYIPPAHPFRTIDPPFCFWLTAGCLKSYFQVMITKLLTAGAVGTGLSRSEQNSCPPMSMSGRRPNFYKHPRRERSTRHLHIPCGLREGVNFADARTILVDKKLSKCSQALGSAIMNLNGTTKEGGRRCETYMTFACSNCCYAPSSPVPSRSTCLVLSSHEVSCTYVEIKPRADWAEIPPFQGRSVYSRTFFSDL